MAVKKVTHGKGSSYEMTAVAGDGKVVRRRFATRKQAADEYARLRAAVNDGTFIAAERARISFVDSPRRWTPTATCSRSPTPRPPPPWTGTTQR